MGSVTSADVAKEAGVSRATVSYVLNETPGQSIPEPTRQRVLDAAQRLGYLPNAGARALRLGRGDVVLFPLGDVSLTHVFGNAVNACSAVLNDNGLTLVADATRHQSAAAAVDAWLRLGPAAVIDLTLTMNDPALRRLTRAGIPRVTADVDVPERNLSPMDIIAIQAREIMVAHLLDRGARDVIYAAPSSVLRGREGAPLKTALRAVARRSRARIRFVTVEPTPSRVRSAVARWVRDGRLPDAICGHSDDLALPIMTALLAKGVGVPSDVAVMGIDDVPAAAVVTPTLSTVTWVVEQLGEALATGARAAIENPVSPARYSAPELSVMARESTDRAW